jgi:hypothetical protein
MYSTNTALGETRETTVKFVRRQGVWHLIDEQAPPEACVIATLRSEVEVKALKKFCELWVSDPTRALAGFEILHNGKRFEVSVAGGEKLDLRLLGEDGSATTVETEFALGPPAREAREGDTGRSDLAT